MTPGSSRSDSVLPHDPWFFRASLCSSTWDLVLPAQPQFFHVGGVIPYPSPLYFRRRLQLVGQYFSLGGIDSPGAVFIVLAPVLEKQGDCYEYTPGRRATRLCTAPPHAHRPDEQRTHTLAALTYSERVGKTASRGQAWTLDTGHALVIY